MIFLLKAQRSKFLFGFLILIYLIIGTNYIRRQSITSDEASFIIYAARWLKGNPERLIPVRDNSKMPVSVLNTVPRVLAQLVQPGLKKSDFGDSDIVHGRYITLLLSVLTMVLLYRWSYKLYGDKAALFSALLFLFCPNSMASATLVTTDAYSELFLLLTIYLLWEWLRNPSWRKYCLLMAALALCQLVKQSLTHLYILVPICMLIGLRAYHRSWKLGSLWKGAILFTLINWAILNLGFYFYQTDKPLRDYQFRSHLFMAAKQTLPGGLPIPFPKPYVEGLDLAKYYDQLGGGDSVRSSFGKVTILGKSSTGGSFWYYYFVSILFKTPISYFVFLGWGLFVLWKKASFGGFMQNEFFLFAPVLYFIILMSFFYNTQCGIRHLVFIYPFLFVFSGILIKFIKGPLQKTVVLFLLIWLIASLWAYRNNDYAYTNELIADKKDAYRYVGSNNLNFGQAAYQAREYLAGHPDIRIVPPQPQAGIFLISVDDYLDVWNRHRYDWLSGIPPAGQVAYAYLLIKVEEKDIHH